SFRDIRRFNRNITSSGNQSLRNYSCSTSIIQDDFPVEGIGLEVQRKNVISENFGYSASCSVVRQGCFVRLEMIEHGLFGEKILGDDCRGLYGRFIGKDGGIDAGK